MTYLTNRLNEYDTYTYNIRLHMVHPQDMSRLDGALDNAILIADNARVAKYNINNVEQIFTVGHGQARETFGNRFQITLVEPNGASLMDTLYKASKSLRITNHLDAGYILTIEFHGRKSNGQPHKFKPEFHYPVKITKMDFKVDDGGSTYNIDAIEFSTSGYLYSNNVIKDQITVQAKTLGEFFDKFQEAYNKSYENAWAANPNAGIFKDNYVFEFDDSTVSWREWKFQALEEEFSQNGANFIGVAGDGEPELQVTVGNGSNITTLFGQVAQLTTNYKRILSTQNSSSDSETYFRKTPSEETTASLESFPIFHKVLTNVEYQDFDPIRGEYQKTIIYRLKAYVVTDEIIDALAYQTSIANTQTQQRRVQNMIANNFLRKRYDYYYTGQNTEVLEFDMQFDYLYYYTSAYGDGYFGDPNIQNPQISQDNEEVIARLKNLADKRQQLTKAARSKSSAERPQDIIRFENLVRTLTQELTTQSQEYQDFLEDNYDFSPSDINHMLRFVPDVVSEQDSGTGDNDRQSGTLKMGALKMNLENSADFAKIELGIRGDPYWMGKPNSMHNAQANTDEIADYEAGSLNFFLNVNFPQPDEDSRGLRKPSPDYQLSGVYHVVNVINRFNNGQFIQYLSAVRDMATNTSTAREILAADDSAIQALDRAQDRRRERDRAQAMEDAHNQISNRGNIQ